MINQTPLDLNPYRNARAATYNDGRASAGLNAWGNSLPAEEFCFGSVCGLSGVEFKMPDSGSAGDHVEALGQLIALPSVSLVNGLALLCFGEMGEQELDIDVIGEWPIHLRTTARGWLNGPGDDLSEEHLSFSHLHYPGDYELDLLRPAIWLTRSHWEPAVGARRLALGINPLFHLFAATLLHEDR